MKKLYYNGCPKNQNKQKPLSYATKISVKCLRPELCIISRLSHDSGRNLSHNLPPQSFLEVAEHMSSPETNLGSPDPKPLTQKNATVLKPHKHKKKPNPQQSSRNSLLGVKKKKNYKRSRTLSTKEIKVHSF